MFNLVKVENAAPGKSPTLTFGVQDKSGKTVAVPKMDRLALVLAGPTLDYASAVSEDPRKTAVANNDGTFRETVFVLNQQGAALNGSIIMPTSEQPFVDGAVTGDTFSFASAPATNPRRTIYRGTIAVQLSLDAAKHMLSYTRQNLDGSSSSTSTGVPEFVVRQQ